MEMTGYAYIAGNGETFDMVALNYYGDEKYAPDIMLANPQYSGRTVFEGGEKLLLPAVEVPETEYQGNTYNGTSAPWKV